MWTQNQEIAKWSLLKMLGKKIDKIKATENGRVLEFFRNTHFLPKNRIFVWIFFLFWTHSVCIWSFNWKNRKINFGKNSIFCMFVCFSSASNIDNWLHFRCSNCSAMRIQFSICRALINFPGHEDIFIIWISIVFFS